MSVSRYRNFFVNIGRLSELRITNVSVSGLTPGPRVADVESVSYPVDYFDVSDNGLQVNLLDKIKRRPVNHEYIYRLGSLLADLALPGRIRSGFLQSYDTVRRNGDRLRLRLITDEPQFAVLPWEYLYLESAPGVRKFDDFLVLRPDMSFARLAAGNTSERPFPRDGRYYKLAVALASPNDQEHLNLEADRAAIQDAVDQSRKVHEIAPLWADPATRESLKDVLRLGCDIFHFSGHGVYADPDGEILLQTADGRSDPLEARYLAQMLSAAETRVAVLSACDAGKFSSANPYGGVATSLAGSGIPAVVASQFKLLDKSAGPLVKEIYRSLLQGHEIDDGVYRARQAILLEPDGFENRDWGAIVLYLRGEDGLVFPPPAGTPPQRLVPRIMPTPLQSPLMGRDEVFTKVGPDIVSGKKLHLHGAVGVGKTSLATSIFLAVADERRFPDGVIWASAGGMDAERLLEYVGSNFPGNAVSEANGKSEKINTLRGILAGYPRLLVGLDNVTSADAARSILEAAGPISVMLNGEAAFDLNGSAEAIALLPLTPSFSQELFLAEAKLKRAQLEPADLTLVTKICDRVRGLPLGIKIAAGKCAEGESLQTVLDRIDSAALATDAVQALVTAVLNELEDAPEAQRLLIRLASFPALEAPLLPLQGDPGVNEDITDFFQAKDKLLALQVIERVGKDRLALHPLLGPLIVRTTAKTTALAERTKVVDWLIAHARQNQNNILVLSAEHRNFIALLDLLEKQKNWKVMTTLMSYLFGYLRVRGLWTEALIRLNLCVTHQGVLSVSERALTYLQRGIIGMLLSRNDSAADDLAMARDLYASIPDPSGVGRVEYRLGALTFSKGELPSAAYALRNAIANMAESAPHDDRSAAHSLLGFVLSSIESADEAIVEFRRALSIAEQSADLEQQARACRAIGQLRERIGDIPSAEAEYSRALTLAEQLGDPLQHAAIEQSIGHLQFHGSRYAEAQSSIESALQKFINLNYQPGVASALHTLANICVVKGNYPDAKRLYGDSLKINETLGHALAAAYDRYQLAIVMERMGDKASAEQGYRVSLEIAVKSKDQNLEGGALLQLAKLAHGKGDDAAATGFATQALGVAVRIGDRISEGLAERVLGNLEGAYKALSKFDGDAAKAVLEEIRTATSADGKAQQAKNPREDNKRFDRHLDANRPPQSSR
jgi:tetratricopeptide (TPR) repeat protein